MARVIADNIFGNEARTVKNIGGYCVKDHVDEMPV